MQNLNLIQKDSHHEKCMITRGKILSTKIHLNDIKNFMTIPIEKVNNIKNQLNIPISLGISMINIPESEFFEFLSEKDIFKNTFYILVRDKTSNKIIFIKSLVLKKETNYNNYLVDYDLTNKLVKSLFNFNQLNQKIIPTSIKYTKDNINDDEVALRCQDLLEFLYKDIISRSPII